MALLIMIFRKMMQNKWLVCSLFLGISISVALVSSMPIYSQAVLTRMLVKDLERLQGDTGQYPGALYGHMFYSDEKPEEIRSKFQRMDNYIRGEGAAGFGLPVLELNNELYALSLKMKRADDPNPLSDSNMQRMTIKSYENLEKHVELKDGRLPSPLPVDGVYEVMVTERALNHFKTVLNTEFSLEDEKLDKPVKLKVVGVFRKAAENDVYFRYGNLSDMSNSFMLPYESAKELLLEQQSLPIGGTGWHLVMDYSKMELDSIARFQSSFDAIKLELNKKVYLYQMGLESRALSTLSQYTERAEQLQTLMWALNIPLLIMLAFYMFMVANLITERQKTEIAVLRSRGAARWQIIASYFVEGLLLCGMAFAAGPFLGSVLTNVLGASSGFLEFVQRVRLPVRITEEAWEYAAITAGACLLIMMIPVIAATRISIVGHKQQLARLLKTPLWHKLFLDVIALGLSLYGLYNFRKRQADLQALGLGADDLSIDPLQFVIPALFIMGGGLLLLRLYPWLLRLVYWIGRKWWPPSLYATLIQVGRSSSQYQFLMIFLVMTIATGVFSASAARTINENTEDRISYAAGADIILDVNWVNDAPPPMMPGSVPPSAEPVASTGRVNYLEPPFEPFRNLPGVESAAKVFVQPKADFFAGNESGSAVLMGIDTDEFGKTAWFRDGLLDHHFYDYLNLLAADTKGVLISRSLAEQKGLKAGDAIWVGWTEVTQQPFTVYGIIDYFPTFNPNPPTAGGGSSAPMLIVGHLSRIQLQLAIEPYKVWLKLEDGASVQELYDGIAESELAVIKVDNTRDSLVRAKNDPFLLALNGVLTLGFVLSILVSFIGFLLYWVLSLKGRMLQNGILRAIGLSLKSLIGMLAAEQLLTSGVAVAIGIGVGNTASRLFVPSFQIAFNPSSLVPPFIVQFQAGDMLRIYTLTGFMLVAGLAILGFMLSRLRIHQALKLGED